MIRVLLVLLLSAGAAFGQTGREPRLRALCDGPYQLCGLRDLATGSPVGPQDYEDVLDFSEGLAPAARMGRYGYVDATGAMVIPPEFDLAGSFHHGLAPVAVDGSIGVIDKQGKMIVPPRFQDVAVLSGQILVARDGRFQHDGREAISLSSNLTFNFFDGVGLFHVQKGWLTEQNYKFNLFTDFEAGEQLFIWAAEKNSEQPLWGLMRIEDGSWAVEPEFDTVNRAVFGRAVARLPADIATGKPSTLIAFVSVSGEVSYKVRIKGLTCPDGSQLFKENDLWGVRGADGKILIPAVHPALSCYQKGIVWLPVAEEGQWCPHGPDGQRRDKPACMPYHNGCLGNWSHTGPEKMDDDPFESSILWKRKLLEVLEDPKKKGPNLVGDGVQGGNQKVEVRSWDCMPMKF